MNKLNGWKKMMVYTIMGLLSVVFILAGAFKLSGAEQMVSDFGRFGLPIWFMYFIGVAEVAGAIALWMPRLSAVAALGLAVIMLGALIMHLVYDSVSHAVPALVFMALLVLIIKIRFREVRNHASTARAADSV